jgi:glycosyltransferase involved in cell wall biosynthesis
LREDVVLLTVGRLVPRKGVAWFVESIVPRLIASGKRFHYVIVGSGPQEESVRDLINRQGSAGVVHPLGQISEADLARAYIAADLFVMPNIRVQGDMEGFGLVALEAGAHGLPVLAADLEGIRDAIIPGQTGALLPSEDVTQWTGGLLALFNDRTSLDKLAQMSRATVQDRFSWSRMVDEYQVLFQDILQRKGPWDE